MILEFIRAEIERMRRQIQRQRKEILDLQRARRFAARQPTFVLVMISIVVAASLYYAGAIIAVTRHPARWLAAGKFNAAFCLPWVCAFRGLKHDCYKRLIH